MDLPAPDGPTRPTFSPGSDGQRQVFDQAAVPPVMEADILEADLAPRDAQLLSRRAHRRTVQGLESASMPSCTVPTFSKIEVMTHMIQPAMLLMRIASPVVTAMAPSEIAPRLQSQSD